MIGYDGLHYIHNIYYEEIALDFLDFVNSLQ